MKTTLVTPVGPIQTKAGEGWQMLSRQIMPIIPEHLRAMLEGHSDSLYASLEEVRLTQGAPLFLNLGSGDVMVAAPGRLARNIGEAYTVTAQDIQYAFEVITGSSIYAWEEEIRSGYLTLPGGHRVGFVGSAVLEGRRIKTLKCISGLNIRLAREVWGAADEALRHVASGSGIRNTLVVSPPRCGKTTLLRDMIRQISYGVPSLGLSGHRVGLVDERSEIASCYRGKPQKDVGPRTDVLDRCPKAEGIMMLIRSMSPEVVATDEIGSPLDAQAIGEALSAGVSIMASAHGSHAQDVALRPGLRPVMIQGAFERIIVLSREEGPGTLEEVLDSEIKIVWKRRRKRVMAN